MSESTPTARSNEDAADEMAAEMWRRFGIDFRSSPVVMRWLASCIGEVRAEVVDPSLPPHRVSRRWSKRQEQTP